MVSSQQEEKGEESKMAAGAQTRWVVLVTENEKEARTVV